MMYSRLWPFFGWIKGELEFTSNSIAKEIWYVIRNCLFALKSKVLCILSAEMFSSCLAVIAIKTTQFQMKKTLIACFIWNYVNRLYDENFSRILCLLKNKKTYILFHSVYELKFIQDWVLLEHIWHLFRNL